ncbi:membrane protein [Mycolicibacterium insubricum]|uniref:Uncharacterized protein n=1 Tax=Mycolicibacterium insubricum TaxID=444597 RepID=A0A1X0DP15_9MYCO|nr:TPM domain-containing protein [Mycolicibacterium insubricum]ORA74105.1 hypothetical protein BST26_00540 [Mycolicibacterium insubricum]BBZ67862.1 membrane protein [Mycolicibacterium insubricum]
MRILRLLAALLAVLLTACAVAPAAVADTPARLISRITDNSGVLSASDRASVTGALNDLYDGHRIKLWVVYVDDFSGQSALNWAKQTMTVSDFGDNDALLAVAVKDRSVAFQVPVELTGGTAAPADVIRRNYIEPALSRDDWAGAAITAAQQLGTVGNDTESRGNLPLTTVALILGLVVLAMLGLWLWSRRSRRRRRAAELEAARHVDPTDPRALARVPLEALDGLSRQIVVDVDNAVRTSSNELALAEEEFGTARTAPFRAAVDAAQAALAKALHTRQILDDAIPETPQQRRELLTAVIVSAAQADRELDAQTHAFDELRDLVINAPERLDALAQQLVALTARVDPAEATLGALRNRYTETALASVAGNVEEARDRVRFADETIAASRTLIAAPAADQTALVDRVRAAEAALQQAQALLDAIDTASGDIDRATAALPQAIADLGARIGEAEQLGPGVPPELQTAHDAATRAVADAQTGSATDPLGVFVRLTRADADLDRVLTQVTEARQAAAAQAQVLAQSLFAAQARVGAVSEYIDTRRGSIGPEARTRLAEARRQLEAAQAKKDANPGEAIAYANGATTLAAQAQALANDDVRAAQRSYAGDYGQQSDLGSVLGGILIGSVLRGGGGGFGGGFGGGYGGGRSSGRPTSYGGAARSSGRSYGGGSGRF